MTIFKLFYKDVILNIINSTKRFRCSFETQILFVSLKNKYVVRVIYKTSRSALITNTFSRFKRILQIIFFIILFITDNVIQFQISVDKKKKKNRYKSIYSIRLLILFVIVLILNRCVK